MLRSYKNPMVSRDWLYGHEGEVINDVEYSN